VPSQLQWRQPLVLDAASQPARQSAVTVWLGAAVRPLGDATPRRWPQRPCQTAGTALPEPHTHPQLKPGYKKRLPTSRGPHFSTALPTLPSLLLLQALRRPELNQISEIEKMF